MGGLEQEMVPGWFRVSGEVQFSSRNFQPANGPPGGLMDHQKGHKQSSFAIEILGLESRSLVKIPSQIGGQVGGGHQAVWYF